MNRYIQWKAAMFCTVKRRPLVVVLFYAAARWATLQAGYEALFGFRIAPRVASPHVIHLEFIAFLCGL